MSKSFHLSCRGADFYIIIKTGFLTVCGSSELNYFSSSESTNITNNASEKDLVLLAASWMTKASLMYEYGFGYVTVWYILCPIFTAVCLCQGGTMNERLTCLLPFFCFDSFAIIVLGPFGNVYLFLLGCTEALVMIGLRIGFYLSTISLPAVFIYLVNNDDPQVGALKTFALVLIKVALKLVTCSSCLATFINIAYPETPVFRFFYLSFTILIGLSALLTYYETLLKLAEIICKCNCMHHDQCCEWFSHCTFWVYVFANLCLAAMNAFILSKYIDMEGFDSSGISLVLNVTSVASGATFYALGATFCGSQPLYKVINKKFKLKCLSRKDSNVSATAAAPYQARINYYVIVY